MVYIKHHQAVLHD